MKKFFVLIISVALLNISLLPSLYAEGRSSETGYWHNWVYDYKRGFKNLFTSPLEIPITVQEYHEQAGPPVLRHLAGFGDGFFQFLTRGVSGAWDLVFAAWVPGAQEGLPPAPEVLF